MAERIDLPGPTRTSDDPVIDRVNMLLRTALDPASRNSPVGENAGRALALAIQSNKLVITNPATNASTGKHTQTGRGGSVTGEVAHLRERLANLQHQYDAVASQLGEYQQREWQARDSEAQTRARIDGYLVEQLTPEVLQLFEVEPQQPGADKIAKKLGRNARGIRMVIAKLVDTGVLVAIGATRNRTYSRPAQSGRESFASTPRETEEGSTDSGPVEGRRDSFTSSRVETGREEADSRPKRSGRKTAA